MGHSRRFGHVPTTSALPQTWLPRVGMSQMCRNKTFDSLAVQQYDILG